MKEDTISNGEDHANLVVQVNCGGSTRLHARSQARSQHGY